MNEIEINSPIAYRPAATSLAPKRAQEQWVCGLSTLAVLLKIGLCRQLALHLWWQIRLKE